MKSPIYRYLIILSLFVLVNHGFAQASESDQILVISSADNDIQTLSKKEVRQIFMGGVLSRKYTPVMQPVGANDRSIFNTSVIGLTENRIQAYWSQLVFTGRSTAPIEIKNMDELISFLRKNTSAVAYVSSGVDIPEDILVVYGE